MELAVQRSGSNLVEGEFSYTEADFRRVAAMLHADAGISLPESKATLVYSRLAKRLRALRLNDFGEYCKLIASPDGADERINMLAALTTNVTRFFREPHHFAHMKSDVLPPLLEAARKGGRVRIWSAACSNGQEPYSIGLTILSLMPDACKYDIKILATDIDPNMIAEAREGVYSAATLAPISPELRNRWFPPAERGGSANFAAADELRDLITFRELNLIGNWPMKGKFDAIMCRNVVIYFEEDTQAKIWSRFAPLLPPKGTLYIGHSERLNGDAAHLFKADGITTYRRLGGAHA